MQIQKKCLKGQTCVHQQHRHHADHHHQGWRVAEGSWFINNITLLVFADLDVSDSKDVKNLEPVR